MNKVKGKFIGLNAIPAIVLLLFSFGCAKQEHQRPNILLILADDMGYSDIGCYGGEIETPNLDNLAANGLRFTQFYNAGRCCPTRASLLTGLNPAQAGMRYMNGPRMKNYYGSLSSNSVTIAEVLKESGYATFMAGKWHVAGNNKAESMEEKDDWPCQRGFDTFYGSIGGGENYFNPNLIVNNERKQPEGENYYYTTAISEKSAEFIESHTEKNLDQPFFMYVAYTAPHFPLHAPEADINKYRGNYMKGWSAVRQERYNRMLQLGIIDPLSGLSPMDSANYAWEELEPEEQEIMDAKMAVYAAMVDVMDRGIGTIIKKLKEVGQLENTLVFFLSDNGACHEPNLLGIWRNTTFWEYSKEDIGSSTTHSLLGQCWANASNTPFRRYKMWIHEGGISTPLIVHWPKGIKAKGELKHQVGHINDIMATCVDVASADYPENYNGNEIIPAEGLSLLPVFKDDVRSYPAFGWEHQDNRGVRKGKWKLVAIHQGEWELYNMETDRTELNDLAGKHPEKVKELVTEYNNWAERCGIAPWEWKTREDMIPLPPRQPDDNEELLEIREERKKMYYKNKSVL